MNLEHRPSRTRRLPTRAVLAGAVAVLVVGLAALPAAAHTRWVNPDESGALVASVDPEGPAANAGIARGDVIVEVAGTEIGNRADLFSALGEVGAGDSLRVVLDRAGSRRSFDLDVGEVAGTPYLGILLGPDAGGADTFGDRSGRRGGSRGPRGRGLGRQAPQSDSVPQPQLRGQFRGPAPGSL